jgi:DNA-binding NarL/FixJ family response regulator
MTALASHTQIRILLADQEGVFRLGLKKLFGAEDDLRVVAEADECGQVLVLAQEFRPGLIFLQAELAARGSDAGCSISQLKSSADGCKVVITASALSEDEALERIQAGASGVILKSVDPELFIRCARKVIDNEIWLPKKEITQMAKLLETVPARSARPRDTLTRREKTIISYLMLGCRNREIARRLSLTEQTIKNHLRAIYDKVGVSDRLELVLYAIHQGLDLPRVDREPEISPLSPDPELLPQEVQC